MWCSTARLVNTEDGYEETRLLPCKSWACDHCAPRRRAQLMAIAASGEPNKCLTLTVSLDQGESPSERYRALHRAWTILVRRALRQWALPPERRWVIRTTEGYEYQEIRSYRNTKEIAKLQYNKMHYMAFAEETKRGEPHLHILLRCPYIPQKWISEQMNDLIKSPVVWIERIKNTKQAIGYVSKYVSKAPAQFGRSRRYWISRGYQINQGDREEKPKVFRKNIKVVRERFQEFAESVVVKGLIPYPLDDGWVRLYTMASAIAEYGSPEAERLSPHWYRMHVEYHRMRQAVGLTGA